MNKFFFLVLLAYWTILPVSGFSLKLGDVVPRGNATSLHPSDANVEQDSSTQEMNHETNAQLNFHGEFSHKHLLIFPSTQWLTRRRLLHSFFQNRLHRNLLLKGGGNPTEEIPRTPELLAKWTHQSRMVSSSPPIPLALNNDDDDNNGEDHHSVIAIYSTVPVIPGLSIKAISYTGCRLLPHPQTMLPMYEFTLIHDCYQAEGTKPLVWLYRKLTGDTPSSDLQSKPSLLATSSTTGSRHTHGLCRVSLEYCSNEALRLTFYSMVQVSCTLPQRLLKLLPLTKQNIEAKISASMVKQLEAEVMQSVDKIHSAWETWLQQENHTIEGGVLKNVI